MPLVYLNHKIQSVVDFINEKRNYFNRTDSDNKFAFALNNVWIKYKQIHILLDEIQRIKEPYINQLSLFNNSNQEKIDLALQTELTDSLEIRIETIFLFSTILCDQTARLIKHFYGEANKLNIETHRNLSKNFNKYCETKNLTFETKTQDLASKIEKEILEYRDKQIAHLFKPRRVKGLSINGPSKNLSISFGYMYPNEKDEYIQSISIEDAVNFIDEYFWSILNLISNNMDKIEIK